jgi:hypothetical protein
LRFGYGYVTISATTERTLTLMPASHRASWKALRWDAISPPELLRQYDRGLPEPKSLHVIPGADLSLLGYEGVVADLVAGFLGVV